MKKIVLATLLASFIGAAQANPYVSLGNSWQENRETKTNSISPELVVGVKEGNWQTSLKAQFSQAELGNGTLTNSVEGRLRYNFNPITGLKLKPYVQGRLGEQIQSNNNFSYYAMDLGLGVPVASKIDVDFTYRYRNAFDTAQNFQTNRYTAEVKYKLTPKDSLGVRYGKSYGDSLTDSWRLQYTHNF